MTYSLDFREKVLEIKERDKRSLEEVAERFMEELKRDVEPKPDAYQYERARRLGVSRRAIG